MSQLLKHYWLNRDTGAWATDTRFGLMMPSISGLEVVYNLSDANDIPFMLSTCPEYFEHTVTTSAEGLADLQNRPGITVISSTERQVQVERTRNEDGTFVGDDPSTPNTDEAWITETVYDVVYQEAHILEESDGLQILTQQEWDAEIVAYDARQEQKRFNLLRPVRDEILAVTDWIVIKAKEQGTNLSTEFKNWRQALRDLPTQTPFPSGFPTLPAIVETDEKVLALYARWNEIRQIPMINDPLQVS